MSEQGAGNPSSHGSAGASGAGLGEKVANFFKEGNKATEDLRGNGTSALLRLSTSHDIHASAKGLCAREKTKW